MCAHDTGRQKVWLDAGFCRSHLLSLVQGSLVDTGKVVGAFPLLDLVPLPPCAATGVHLPKMAQLVGGDARGQAAVPRRPARGFKQVQAVHCVAVACLDASITSLQHRDAPAPPRAVTDRPRSGGAAASRVRA